MPVDRMAKVNELLRQKFAEALEREVELPPGVLVTAKRVVTSRDLSGAKVWLSVLPSDKTDETLGIIEEALPTLQRLVAEQVALQQMPRLRLLVDESEERAAHINELLDGLASE